jgi:hypothetical protein
MTLATIGARGSPITLRTSSIEVTMSEYPENRSLLLFMGILPFSAAQTRHGIAGHSAAAKSVAE